MIESGDSPGEAWGAVDPAPDSADPATPALAERELREEIDRLRVENQQLRGELEALQETGELLRRSARSAADEVRHRLRGMARRLRGAPTPASPPETPPATRPYRVRMLHAPEPARPRVLHFIGNFYLGGSSRLVVDLIERLGHRYEQEVVTRDLPESPAFTGLAIRHHPVFRSAEEAGSVIRSFAPDLIHVHYLGHHRTAYSESDWKWYHRVFQAAERMGCRVIQNVNIPVTPYVSDSVSSYVYVSDYVRGRFGMLDGPNVTIYPGSDLGFFAGGDDPAQEDTIGMVYRLQRDKLDEGAIDVFLEVVRRRPGTRVLIVGGGPLLSVYRRRVAEARLEDAFTFPGYVAYEELPTWYRRMSVFVAPVHRESFGQVTPFAMGMRLPVAGYDVGAIGEILGNDEVLAPPGDAASLAAIVVRLLDDRERRQRLGEENRRRAVQRFSLESMIDSYDRLYRSTLGG